MNILNKRIVASVDTACSRTVFYHKLSEVLIVTVATSCIGFTLIRFVV